MQYYYLKPDAGYAIDQNAVMLFKRKGQHRVIDKRELFTEREINKFATLAFNKSKFNVVELRRCRTFKTSDGRRFRVPDV